MHYFVSYFNISVLSAIIVKKKKRMRNNLGLRAVNALSVINHPDRMVRKASDVSAADWQYQTKKLIINLHSHVHLRLSIGLEIVVKICN